MGEAIDSAIAALSDKLGGGFEDGIVRFDIEDEGSIIVDGDGVREGDVEADVTLGASADTFKAILDGEMNPTMAFMSGQLKVDGDMGLAMKLGSALS